MWKAIKESKDWILITIGLILITFAVFNLINFNPFTIIQDLQETPAVEQEGFAPLFIPKTTNGTPESAEGDRAVSKAYIPERIVIEKIGLDAPVKTAEAINVTIDDQDATQFLIPEEYAAGWHEGSAALGVPGNTVISGHHNAFGKVFAKLVDLEVGDEVIMLSGKHEFHYIIANKMILPEKKEPLDVRLENARWILPSDDERLTLVTCWPANSNTHRLILVAVPIETPEEESTPSPTPTKAVQLNRPLTEILTSGATATPVPILQEFIVRNAGRYSVNIRDMADMQGEIIGSFKAGDEASGLGRTDSGDWIYIDYMDTLGWVSAELVEILSPVESLPTMIPPIESP
jgi:LPXTG-site transpeptidase (sortase) family protein